ncbi:monovalent cation/H(+) antiporter subunit G [Hyphobacterium sp. CCMP332]|nr:monovalent cation/H(+) antiporter subunit G [Hyphobacterium sp. CCMP332]
MTSIFAAILLGIGVLFNLFGCIGLVRLPDVYNRLQSATKCVTLGTCSILLSVLIYYGFNSIGVKALIAIPLLFFSATVAAHALARGSYQFGIRLGEKTVVDHYKDRKTLEEGGKNEISEDKRDQGSTGIPVHTGIHK